MDIGLSAIKKMMDNAVSEGVFSGGSISVSIWGKKIFRADSGLANIYKGTPIVSDTVFDLASLTKPLATSMCMMKLVQDGVIGLEDSLGGIIPAFTGPKKHIKILDLLCHKSGLPAHRPYYENLSTVNPGYRKTRLSDFLINEGLENPIGKNTVYSDLGFMILRMIIEEVSSASFENCFMEWIAKPIGLKDTFFYDSKARGRAVDEFAATENCPFRRSVMQGETHDLNAFYSGGYDGHAGLFGTVDDVDSILKALTDIYTGIEKSGFCDKSVARHFLQIPSGYERALGFDVPSKEGSSSGRFFSDHSVGHLGYTGTSFWLDLETGLCVILLTNRVHPTALNINIRRFRPLIHDCVFQSLSKAGLI